MNNTAIWDQVCKTDPDMTDRVNFGAFKFTTIDSMYQIQQATKLFGPCGTGWGTRNERFVMLTVDPADPHYNLLTYQAEFFYVSDGKEGKYEIAADIELFENTKNGWKRVSDPVKKVRTAALSKGLSWLGFSADVFLGKFDDARYVNQLKNEKQQEQYQAKVTAKPTAPPPIVQHFTPPNTSILADIKRIATLLNLIGDDFVQWLKDTHNTTWKRLDDETSRLVLMDLQELCADASADAIRADGLEYEAIAE